MKCSKCGYENIGSARWCNLCKTVLVKTKIGEVVDVLFFDEKQRYLLIEARAQIFWGYPLKEVHSWLTTKSFPQDKIEGCITVAVREYSRWLKKTGISDILLGITLVFLSFFLMVSMIKEVSKYSKYIGGYSGGGRVLGFLGLIFFYGSWCIGRGSNNIIKSRTVKKQLASINTIFLQK